MKAATIIDRTSIKAAIDQLNHLAGHLESQTGTYTPVEVLVLVMTVHNLSNLVVCMDALKDIGTEPV